LLLALFHFRHYAFAAARLPPIIIFIDFLPSFRFFASPLSLFIDFAISLAGCRGYEVIIFFAPFSPLRLRHIFAIIDSFACRHAGSAAFRFRFRYADMPLPLLMLMPHYVEPSLPPLIFRHSRHFSYALAAFFVASIFFFFAASFSSR